MTAPDTKAIRAQMEALAGHTMGPWHLCAHLANDDENGCSCGYRGVIYGPQREGYAVCQPGHEPAPEGQEGTEPPRYERSQEVRNARLIAVAPDMRTTILALCDALDAANAEARLLRSAVTHAHADVHDLLGVATDDEADAILAAWSRIGRALPDTDAQVIDKLRTEVERLRTALAPFLKAAELFPEPPGTVKFDISIYCPAAGPEFELRGDDLRRARDALAQKGGE